MKTHIFYIFIFCCSFTLLNAQEYVFGKVGTAILEETQDSVFKDAPAKVVYRRIVLNYGKELEIHERIKIYNEDGFEYSNWEIPFPEISYLQAYTYNLEDGIVEKTHVKKNSIFKEEVQGDYEITKIPFPKVKKGSVIEIKYKVKNIRSREIPIQSELPIQNFRLVVQNVKKWMDFKQNPNNTLAIVEEDTKNEKVKIFSGKNIPPVKVESFVNNLDNYRGKMFIKSVSETTVDEKWSEIAGFYNNSHYFGEQLKVKPYFHKDILHLIKDKRDTLGTAKIIYKYLQNTIEYDDRYSTGVYNISEKYKDKKASKGAINLMLTSILRYLGYKANAMVVACRHRGELLFPEERMFNATVCSLQIGTVFYVMDASEKHLKFGLIPIDLMNDYGLVILEDGGSISYPTRDTQASVSNAIVTTKLNLEDNSAYGNARNRVTNHLAWQYRKYAEDAEELVMKDALEQISPSLEIDAFEELISEDSEDAVDFSYNFIYKDAVEEIAGKLYVSPFLFLGSTNNKFEETERLYPIDLEFPEKEVFTITFHIPEGYTLESLPENKNIVLAENLGSLTFVASKQQQLMQLRLSVQINYSFIPASYYSSLQTLFDEYTKISNSKIVLSKI
jgi:hypothetical protein